jgi:hypothetical protein
MMAEYWKLKCSTNTTLSDISGTSKVREWLSSLSKSGLSKLIQTGRKFTREKVGDFVTSIFHLI